MNILLSHSLQQVLKISFFRLVVMKFVADNDDTLFRPRILSLLYVAHLGKGEQISSLSRLYTGEWLL